ncbi:MAG: hypothetical protein CV045_03370 [Cyanobacteria bacterium M5B4]|nr:MAG: hypothetical protein CV045_03370 [Cyanobacteria bacterium M5B4]
MNLDFFPIKLTNDRLVFLVKIASGWGEIAPLSMNKELYDRIVATLTQLKQELKPIDIFSLEQIPLFLTGFDCFVRYGVEQALLHDLANRRGQSLAQLLCKTNKPKHNLKINALISRVSPQAAGIMTDKLIGQGYTNIKIKVGSADIKEDIERVQTVRQRAGNRISIHLDANGAWQKNNVIHNLSLLSPFMIDYIEQPVKTLAELAWLNDRSPIPVAVDEAVTSLAELQMAIKLCCCNIFVIKPAFWGGILPARAGLELALSQGRSVVLTGTLEGAIGRWGVYELGRAYSLDRACGLTGFDYADAGLDYTSLGITAELWR